MEENTIEQKLKNFFDLKTEVAVLTEKMNKEKEEVTAFLKTQPEMKYSVGEGETAVGFSLRATPVYEFSGVVESLEGNSKLISDKIKEVKKNEIESGVAKVVNTQYAVYTK